MKTVYDENGNEITVAVSECFLRDMGYANPEETRTKFLLTSHIENLIADLGLGRDEAAGKTNLPAEFFDDIIAGRVEGISVWQLMKALGDLGAGLDIVVHPPGGKKSIIEIA